MNTGSQIFRNRVTVVITIAFFVLLGFVAFGRSRSNANTNANSPAQNMNSLPDEVTVEAKNGPLSINCSTDADCTIANTTTDYSVCWPDACAAIDWSLPEFVAVKRASLDERITELSPPVDSCGPAPACPIQFHEAGYTARCLDGLCAKVLKDE